MNNDKKAIAKQCEFLFKEVVISQAKGKCEVCGSTFGVTNHHFIPRSLAGHMIYWFPNGVCLCRSCHFSLHTKSDPAITEAIKQKRGIKWFKQIEKKRAEKHKPSFKTLGWLQGQLGELKVIQLKILEEDDKIK